MIWGLESFDIKHCSLGVVAKNVIDCGAISKPINVSSTSRITDQRPQAAEGICLISKI